MYVSDSGNNYTEDKVEFFRDKLLGMSFLCSLVINVLCVILIGNSDIFNSHAVPVKNDVIKTIVFHVKKLPPPPKPPPPPKIKPVVEKVITPHPVQQVVQHHVAAYVPHVMTVASKSDNAPDVGPQEQAAPVARPTDPGNGPETQTPSAPTEPATPGPPTPPAPAPPAPVAPPAPPPPPPAPPAPPAMPDRAEPIAITSWDEDIVSGVDVDTGTLASTTVTVRFTVNEDGDVVNCKVIKSSGNNDLDQNAIDACRKMRYKPAVQDGVPRSEVKTHDFIIST